MTTHDGLYIPPTPEWLRDQDYVERQFVKSLRNEDENMSTALVPAEGMDIQTGEVVPLPVKYDARQYLANLNAGMQVQQQLAAAYDAACASLVGPNDVQVEGGRTFKKKSAWRKLARHFGLSTSVVHRDREWIGEEFCASITVRAVAPWGQYAEAEGACCTDEETGRRTISIADAIATAETRATNRAISNLIAMGEVSADELNTGRRKPPAQSAACKAPEDKVLPFGDKKGTRLGDLTVEELSKLVAWCREKDAAKFADLIDACEAVLEGRRIAVDGSENWPEN